MRRLLAVLAASGSLVVLAGCASDVGNSIDEAKSSAASVGAGVRSSAASVTAALRQACQASGTSLTQPDDLRGKLADASATPAQLTPQAKQTVDNLAAQVGDRDELAPVVAAGRDLVKALDGG